MGRGGGTHRSWPGGRGAWSKFRNVCRIFVVSNVYKKKKNSVFLKDALWSGEGVPTRAGLVDGGVNQGPWFQDKGSGKGWRWGKGWGGSKGFDSGGVGGRGTGPGTEQISQQRKMAFFEGCPVPELAWWTGGRLRVWGKGWARARGGSKGFGSGKGRW